MKNSNNITITWTNGQFEKSWEAKSIDEAISISKNTDYWPIEIEDYSKMTAIISDGKKETVLTYKELCNA